MELGAVLRPSDGFCAYGSAVELMRPNTLYRDGRNNYNTLMPLPWTKLSGKLDQFMMLKRVKSTPVRHGVFMVVGEIGLGRRSL